MSLGPVSEKEREKIEDYFESKDGFDCPICFENPMERPMQTQCLHHICATCMPRFKIEDPCPICKTTIKSFTHDFRLQSRIDEKIKKIKDKCIAPDEKKDLSGKEEAPSVKPESNSLFGQISELFGFSDGSKKDTRDPDEINSAINRLLDMAEPQKETADPMLHAPSAPVRNAEQAVDPEIKKAYSFIEALSQILDMDSAKKIAGLAQVPLEKRTDPKTILKYIFEIKYKKSIESFKGILRNCCAEHYDKSQGDDFVSFLPELWEDTMGSEMQLEDRIGRVLPKKQSPGNAQPAANVPPAPAPKAENRYVDAGRAFPFPAFMIDCAGCLTKDDVKLFAVFGIPAGTLDIMLRSDNPGRNCMDYLAGHAHISEKNIDKLLEFANKNIGKLNANFVACVYEYKDMLNVKAPAVKMDSAQAPAANVHPAPAHKAENKYVNTGNPFFIFTMDCARYLTKDDVKLFAVFGIPAGTLDSMLRSDNPGRKGMEYLVGQAHISEKNIDKLLEFTNKNIGQLDAGFVNYVYEYNDMLNKKAPAANMNLAPVRNVAQAVVELREMEPPVKASNAVPQNQPVNPAPAQLPEKDRVYALIREFAEDGTTRELGSMCDLAGVPVGTREMWKKQGAYQGTLTFLKYLFEKKCNGNPETFKDVPRIYFSNNLLKKQEWTELWQKRIVQKVDRPIPVCQQLSPQDSMKFDAFLNRLSENIIFNSHSSYFNGIPKGHLEDFKNEGMEGTVKAFKYIYDNSFGGKIIDFGGYLAWLFKANSPGIHYPMFQEKWKQHISPNPPAPKRPW